AGPDAWRSRHLRRGATNRAECPDKPRVAATLGVHSAIVDDKARLVGAGQMLISQPTISQAPLDRKWLIEPVTIIAWAVSLIVIANGVWRHPLRSSVYPIFTEAARHWMAGQNLYEPNSPYRYAPIIAIGFVPLAKMSDR